MLWDVVRSEHLVKWDPKPPTIAVSELNSSSVDITLWLWVSVEDYWEVWKHIREDIYIAFNEADIDIPFPQVSVHQMDKSPKVHMDPRQDPDIDRLRPHFASEAIGEGE